MQSPLYSCTVSMQWARRVLANLLISRIVGKSQFCVKPSLDRYAQSTCVHNALTWLEMFTSCHYVSRWVTHLDRCIAVRCNILTILRAEIQSLHSSMLHCATRAHPLSPPGVTTAARRARFQHAQLLRLNRRDPTLEKAAQLQQREPAPPTSTSTAWICSVACSLPKCTHSLYGSQWEVGLFISHSLWTKACSCPTVPVPSAHCRPHSSSSAVQLSSFLLPWLHRASCFKTNAPCPQSVLLQILFFLFSTVHPLVSALSSAVPPLSLFNKHAISNTCLLYIYQLTNVPIKTPRCR